MDNFDFVTICGSMRNYPAMLPVAAEYTLQGFIVLMPFVIARQDVTDATKGLLDDMHRVKIDASVGIIVVGNPGDSTRREIDYAHTTNKWIEHRPGIEGI